MVTEFEKDGTYRVVEARASICMGLLMRPPHYAREQIRPSHITTRDLFCRAGTHTQKKALT